MLNVEVRDKMLPQSESLMDLTLSRVDLMIPSLALGVLIR